jgi:hypothetical protein
LTQTIQDFRVDLGGRMFEDRSELGVRFDLERAHHHGRADKQRCLGRIAADGCQRREPIERPVQ